jgi:hypothetical protein
LHQVAAAGGYFDAVRGRNLGTNVARRLIHSSL